MILFNIVCQHFFLLANYFILEEFIMTKGQIYKMLIDKKKIKKIAMYSHMSKS